MADQSTSPTPAPEPQAVTDAPGVAAHFIVFTITEDPAAPDVVRAFFGQAAALVRSVARRFPDEYLSMVVGIGSDAWDRLFGEPRPAHLHVLPEFHGDVHSAPSTPGDLLLHIRGSNEALCVELSMLCASALGDAVTPIDEISGFRYFDARSMVGFVDGTENPAGAEAVDATVIGDDDPAFTGGSYVIVQKYIHDMDAWNALSTEDQERAIGRTKADDVELPEGVKPTNSHSSLNVVTDETGEELAILRANLPFATPAKGEFGTFFIGYAADPAVTELMLTNMFIGRPPGNYDRLLDFSTAVTGTLFFVPSASMLESLADGNPAAPQEPSPEATQPSGTLEIGSLKGQPQVLRSTGGFPEAPA